MAALMNLINQVQDANPRDRVVNKTYTEALSDDRERK